MPVLARARPSGAASADNSSARLFRRRSPNAKPRPVTTSGPGRLDTPAGFGARRRFSRPPSAAAGVHEHAGIPPEAISLLNLAVEIPVIGTSASLNVAVAGSLVLYRLPGFL